MKLVQVVLAILLLLILVGAITSCNTVALELGAGYDRYIESGSNPRSVIRLRGELDGCFNTKATCVVEFDHASSYLDGWPFNDRAEDLQNQFSIIYRYPIWQAK